MGVAYLRERGWPEEMLRAILAHADYSGVKPETHLERTVFACDELAGFLTACALVKPTKRIADVEAKGAVKKMKDKGFARAVKREDMTQGAELAGGGAGGACGGLSPRNAGESGGSGFVSVGALTWDWARWLRRLPCSGGEGEGVEGAAVDGGVAEGKGEGGAVVPGVGTGRGTRG